MTVTTGSVLRWRVPGPDGVAHLFPRKGPAACGLANQDERYDRGPNRRSTCPPCKAVSGDPISESEARVLDGNR